MLPVICSCCSINAVHSKTRTEANQWRNRGRSSVAANGGRPVVEKTTRSTDPGNSSCPSDQPLHSHEDVVRKLHLLPLSIDYVDGISLAHHATDNGHVSVMRLLAEFSPVLLVAVDKAFPSNLQYQSFWPRARWTR